MFVQAAKRGSFGGLFEGGDVGSTNAKLQSHHRTQAADLALDKRERSDSEMRLCICLNTESLGMLRHGPWATRKASDEQGRKSPGRSTGATGLSEEGRFTDEG